MSIQDGQDHPEIDRTFYPPVWMCRKCSYMNSGGICTHCGAPQSAGSSVDLDPQ